MRINGRKIFARGGNWVPVDLFFGRVNAAWLEQVALQTAALCNTCVSSGLTARLWRRSSPCRPVRI